MSATGRSDVRVAGDVYRTPASCVVGIAPRVLVEGPFDLIIDPGCGDGAIGVALRPLIGATPLLGIEIDPALAEQARATGVYSKVLVADFVSWRQRLSGDLRKWPRRLVFGNPPFSLAREFTEEALYVARHVCFLLRLGWLETAERRDFHHTNPADVHVLPERPSFCTAFKCKTCDRRWTKPAGTPMSESGGCCEGAKILRTDTDATAYGWFFHHPGPVGRIAVL